ncbi:MAG: hypothetical protein P8Z31_06290 [Gammaproteobacteria bacterium]|jgi:hypothetical protein
MLDRLNRLAGWLLPVRNLFLGLAILGFLMIVASLFIESRGEEGRFVIPFLMLFLWAFSVYVFIINFAVVPSGARQGDGLMRRSWQRARRTWYWLVALFFLLTTAACLYLTIRLVMLWLRDFF